MKNTGTKAFTMAEILITLVVIGIVATLTIPSLITNYKEKTRETQNNKAKSSLTNGIKLLLSNEGVTTLKNGQIMNCDETDKECLSNEIKRGFNVIKDNNSNSSDSIFNREYQFTSGSREVWTDSSISYTFITSDGMMFGITPHKDSGSLVIISDLNGAKNPNKGAEDLTKFTLTNFLTIIDQRSSMADWQGTPDPICSWDNLGNCDMAGCEALDISDDGYSAIWEDGQCVKAHQHSG